MRKRTLIGAMAVAVIGVAAYFLSQPRKGTLEYHKKGFLRAKNSWLLGKWLAKPAMSRLNRVYCQYKAERAVFHEEALIELGFLHYRTFALSNSQPYEAVYKLRTDSGGALLFNPDLAYCEFMEAGTNGVFVVGTASVIDRCKEVIRDLELSRLE